MRNPGKPPTQASFLLQFQQTLQKSFYQRIFLFRVFSQTILSIPVRLSPRILRTRYQGCQDLPGMGCFPHHQMTQISLMTHPVVITDRTSAGTGAEIRQHCVQNPAVIFIHDPASVYSHYIIKTAPLMHPQRKRAILHLVSESKFHLIPVAIHLRASLYTFPAPAYLLSLQAGVQQAFHLFLLHPELLLIWQREVSASSAYSKMGTRCLRLQR